MGWHRDPRWRYSTLDGSDLRDSAGIYRISEGGVLFPMTSRMRYTFLVAVDFGTTFSSVAYVGYSHEHQRRHLTMSQIEMVDAFPYWTHRNTPVQDVPTKLWYPGPGQQPDGTKRYPNHQQKPLARTVMDADSGREESSSDSESDSDSNSDSEHTPRPNGLPDSNCCLMRASPRERRGRHCKTTCRRLSMAGLIETDTDLIAHYLEQLFRHTRDKAGNGRLYS